MAKITFRASEDLVERLESHEGSKSEILREALRTYLDGPGGESSQGASIDELVTERVDELIDDRLGPARRRPQDVNVTIALEGEALTDEAGTAEIRKTGETQRETDAEQDPDVGADEAGACGQCGARLPEGAIYCSNCGEKAARRIFCECGDELRSDWSFCPTCGRRTPAADVLSES